jgi:L-lactate dehydrogenase (cytochrome)
VSGTTGEWTQNGSTGGCSSPAPMTVLYEMRQLRPDLLAKHEVFIDGGVTRGTDVLKALCLGARAVGLGRAFLYANSVWGEEGCMRVIESKYWCGDEA